MELSNSKKNIIYLGCILMVATIQLSAMGLNNTMYSILTRMDGIHHYSLVAVLSGLGAAIMTPVGGKLGDIFGRRNVAIVAAAFSAICMVIMGITNSLMVFIVARAILSFGTGAFTSIPFAISADVFTQEEYPQKVGMLSATLAAAVFLGATIAGALNDMGYISVAIIYPGVLCVIGALLIFFNMPNKKSAQKPVVDYVGILLLAVFLTALSLSFSFAGGLGFTNPIILAGFALAVISAIVLYKAEKKHSQPVVPFYLFKNPKYTGVCIISGLLACYQLVMGVHVPVTGQAIMGLSSTVTGFFTLPRTILCIILPTMTAIWVKKNAGRMRFALIIAAISVTVAFIGMAFTGPTTAIFVPFVLLGITGIGEGFKSVAGTPLVARQLEPKDIGVGIALNNMMGSLAPTIYSAIVGSFYTSKSQVDPNGALVMVYWMTAAVSFGAVLIAVFMLKDKKPANVA